MLLFLFLILLINPQIAINGARNGIVLWFYTIVPTLLPYMFLSKLLVHTQILSKLAVKFKVSFSELFVIVITGLLCGFPMGAIIISDYLSQNKISKTNAQILLSVCNNFSPAFITGFIVKAVPDELKVITVSIIYLIPICSLLIQQKTIKSFSIDSTRQTHPKVTDKFDMLYDIYWKCLYTLLSFSFFIVASNIFIEYIDHLLLPKNLKAVLFNALEITSGVQYMIVNIHDPIKYIFLISFTIFGGICGCFQIYAIIKDTGLSMTDYIQKKLIQSAAGAFISAFIWLCYY